MAVHSAPFRSFCFWLYKSEDDICRLELTIFDFIFSSFVYFFFRLPLHTQKNSKKDRIVHALRSGGHCAIPRIVCMNHSFRCACVFIHLSGCYAIAHALMLPETFFFSVAAHTGRTSDLTSEQMALFSNFFSYFSFKTEKKMNFSDLFVSKAKLALPNGK